MKSKIMMMSSLLISICLLSGCWDKKELPDLALVAALGIDIDEDGMYVGTFQIIVPGNVAGGLQGGGGAENAPITVYTSTGKNIVDMSRRVSNKISRSLYYSHANLLVIGEELAKSEGISKVLEALDRDIQFRKTTKVVIAKEAKAADILEVTAPIDKIPADKIIKTIEKNQERWGSQISVNLREVIESLTTGGKEAVIPGVKIKGNIEDGKKIENLQNTAPETTIESDGLAVFKGDKMIHWFEERESRGIVWILDKVKRTNISIDWKEERNVISFQVIKEKTKVSIKLKDGKPDIDIHVITGGDIGEAAIPINLEEQHIRTEIERKVETEIKNMIMNTFEHAQTHQTDIFGFGEQMYRTHPQTWKKLKDHWNDQHFPELHPNVTVDASIVRMGLRNIPFNLQMETDHD